MANGILFSTESLPVTPKYRHVSNDSNSENTPPELFTATVGSSTCDLFCTEVIDERELQKPVLQPRKPSHSDSFNHPPVKANSDSILLKDDRVLQNLLRNEERYAPINPDYFKYIQVEVKPHMREEVARWMLDVCEDNYLNEHATNSTEVFCLAINFMDRFLAQSRYYKSLRDKSKIYQPPSSQDTKDHVPTVGRNLSLPQFKVQGDRAHQQQEAARVHRRQHHRAGAQGDHPQPPDLSSLD